MFRGHAPRLPGRPPLGSRSSRSLLPIPLVQVAVSRVREDDHDDARTYPLRKSQGRIERCAARRADEEALLAREAAGGSLRVLRGHEHHFVGHARIPDSRNARGLEVLNALEAVERTVRLDADKSGVRVPCLEVPTHPDERPCGPEACDEVRYAALRLVPDLRARGFEVRPPVRLVVVLIEIPVRLRLCVD